MAVFVLPIMLIAWLEANWAEWLVVLGVHIPLTLLVILWLRYRGWVDGWQALALAGLGGYVLDLLASARPGQVLLSMVVAVGLSSWLLSRSQYRWQRWGSLGTGLLMFEVMAMFLLGWPAIATSFWQLGIFVGLSLVVFGLIRWMSLRIEAWL